MTTWKNEKKLQIGSQAVVFDDTKVLMDDDRELFGDINSKTQWTNENKS